MATQAPSSVPVGPDTLITIKILIDGTNRRFKLPLRELGAHSLPQKLRFLLAIPPDVQVFFARYSDSAGAYIALDSNNPTVYKQLYRAAKAKLKLRISATLIHPPPAPVFNHAIPTFEQFLQRGAAEPDLHGGNQQNPNARRNYLDTVLSALPDVDSHTLTNAAATQSPIAHLTNPMALPVCATIGVEKASTKPATQDSAKKEPAKSAMKKPTCTRATSGNAASPENFCIDCNNCGGSIPDEHYHCGACDDGDYDLCLACIDGGITCYEKTHWLIKRRIQNGCLTTSVTETIAPKKWQDKEVEATKETPTPTAAPPVASRTCNSCIRELSDQALVTCLDCPDFDLCVTCLYRKHGHHPAHRFKPLTERTSPPSCQTALLRMCEPGRDVKHAAVCDGCDKHIRGVRHKCLSCPDWDYCETCVQSASEIHPGHRFAKLYQEIEQPTFKETTHFGIWCDGTRCASKAGKQYIRGIRYKCTVCHDTDFCANCEAFPGLEHNPTHPLIKFQTPVMHVSVMTVEQKQNSKAFKTMGDRPVAKNASTETTPTAQSPNAASDVQTVAEVKPLEVTPVETEKTPKSTLDLQALFEKDSTPDGTKMMTDCLFFQTWTMRNPGPETWPAGCAVSFTGGDHMLNVDSKNPSSVSAMATATRSTVIKEPVEPNQKAHFTVLLKSPDHAGRAISYWRLKTADGNAFGHKLWVDINVSAVDDKKVKDEEPAVNAETQETVKEEDSAASSTMIFPKLEKESPVSSVHDLPSTQATAVNETAPASDKGKAKVEDVDDLADDLDSLGFEDDDTDDGFLTDDEYDILDASDEDLLAEMQKAKQ